MSIDISPTGDVIETRIFSVTYKLVSRCRVEVEAIDEEQAEALVFEMVNSNDSRAYEPDEDDNGYPCCPNEIEDMEAEEVES